MYSIEEPRRDLGMGFVIWNFVINQKLSNVWLKLLWHVVRNVSGCGECIFSIFSQTEKLCVVYCALICVNEASETFYSFYWVSPEHILHDDSLSYYSITYDHEKFNELTKKKTYKSSLIPDSHSNPKTLQICEWISAWNFDVICHLHWGEFISWYCRDLISPEFEAFRYVNWLQSLKWSKGLILQLQIPGVELNGFSTNERDTTWWPYGSWIQGNVLNPNPQI